MARRHDSRHRGYLFLVASLAPSSPKIDERVSDSLITLERRRSSRLRAGSGGRIWYRIPDAQFSRVKRASLTLLSACGQHGTHGAIP